MPKHEKYDPLYSAIERLAAEKETVNIVIDGKCGAGKTTFAAYLVAVYECNVIHMDDFFLPPALRKEGRLTVPGGNVHYERFIDEVGPGLRNGEPITYRVFDCAMMDYNGVVTLPPKPLNIVEGSYSLHPELASLYDLKVFMTVSEEEQKRRLLERSKGKSKEKGGYQLYLDKWIPLENRYFKAYRIPQNCDFIF